MSAVKDNICEKHPDELLAGYLEGALSEEHRSQVEAHLTGCERCRLELGSISELIQALKNEKELFCPEPWQLSDYLENGFDPEQLISAHIKTCSLCKAEIDEYTAGAQAKILPERLRKALDESFSKTGAPKKSTQHHFLEGMLEKIRSFLGRPWFTIGTLAAAVLAVVMLYPGSPTQTMIGLSQLDWDVDSETPRPKSVFAQKPKPGLTVIVTLENFGKALSQSEMDHLYQALKPGPDIFHSFRIVSPKKLNEFAKKSQFFNKKHSEALTEFFVENDVSFALIITIKPESNMVSQKYSVQARVINTSSNETVAQKNVYFGTENDLIQGIVDVTKILANIR